MDAFLEFLKKFWGILLPALTIVILVFDVGGIYSSIKRFFTPQRELFQEESTIKGLLIPSKIKNQYQYIVLKYGTYQENIYLSQLENGIAFKSQFLVCFAPNANPPEGDFESVINMNLQIIKDRLTVSITLKDFKSGEVVGELNNNNWTLYKRTLLKFYDSDKLLEVIDRYGYVVFSLFIDANTIDLQGYFMGKYCGTVVDRDGVASTDRTYPDFISEMESSIQNIVVRGSY